MPVSVRETCPHPPSWITPDGRCYVCWCEAEVERLREALLFYAEEDSEFDVGGVDGGRRALEVLGRPLGGQHAG